MSFAQVTTSPDTPPPALDTGEGIVGALMMVMQKRSKAIHSSGNHSITSACFFFIIMVIMKGK